MTLNYHFKDYLTEASLGDFLKTVFGDKVTCQIKIDKRMSCDYCITGSNGKLYIEFDGPYHYTSPTSALNDIKKKDIICKNGLDNIIRIPYFVQIDNIIWKHLFVPYLKYAGLEQYTNVNITTDWKHGFISEKIIYPASYCSLGLERFLDEIRKFDKVLNDNIYHSLREAAKRAGHELLVFYKKCI